MFLKILFKMDQIKIKMKIVYKLMHISPPFAKFIQNDYLEKPYIQNLILGEKCGIKIFNSFGPNHLILTSSILKIILENLEKSYIIKIETLKLIKKIQKKEKG